MASTASPSPQGGLSRLQVGGLIALMLTSGAANSLFSKYQDMQIVDPATGKKYEQPVMQTATMFIGESICLAAFAVVRYRRRLQRRSAIKRARAGERQAAKYSKLPIDDSGVVLNDTAITLRTQHGGDEDDQLSEGECEEDDGVGVHAHKSVVGPDELIPGQEEPVPKEGEQLSGTQTLLMWLPALFDICGTTFMNVGLLWVPVSVYQMLRGALVLWVGLFSVLFLGRRLPGHQWASLLVVMLGVAVVGLSNSVGSPTPAPGSGGEKHGEHAVDVGKAVVGATLVLFAQIFTASQFVIEEKIMTRYSVEPLRAVGLEGVFGLGTTLFLMPILYFTLGHTAAGQGGYFDVPSSVRETFSNEVVWITSLAIACSIAFFNFSGLAVTKSVSATARSLIDTCRTIVIWAVSLFLGWEQLAGLQILGFVLLVYGTLCFNEVIHFPSFLGFRTEHQLKRDAAASGSSDTRERPELGRATSDDARPIVVIRHHAQDTDERTPLVQQGRAQ